MANIKSAQKRISTIERRNQENRFVRATLSTKVKKFRKMLEEGKVAEAEKFSKEVYAYIDSACSKGVIHKNAASRKVGRLAAALYKAKTTTVAPVEAKKEEKVEKVEEVKTEATETAPKKAPAKKATTAKKTTKKAE
jgi:small subunit ribosomal protein S20